MQRNRIRLSFCSAFVLLVALGSGAQAAAEVNTLVSPDLFGETVDLVAMGFIHWNEASGDTIDPDGDAEDVDNNFGDHSGAITKPIYSSQAKTFSKGSLAAEFAYAYGDNTVSWNFKVPGPGRYVIATRLWSEGGGYATAVFSYRSGEQWIDLPAVDDVTHWGGMPSVTCFLIEVPAGQEIVPVRVRAKYGRVLLLRVLLGKEQTASPFIKGAKPVHPSMHFHRADIPKMKSKIRSGPPKMAYEYMLARFGYYRGIFQDQPRKWTPKKSNHHVGAALAQTAFLHVLTGKKEHFDLAVQMVEKIMSWQHTPDVLVDQRSNRYNVLTRGRNLSMMALVYDWLYAKLPAETRRRMREFMAAEANRLYLYRACSRQILESNNWGPWIAAGPGMVGIALRDEHRWAGDWIECMKGIFHVNLAASGEDYGYFVNGFTKAIDFGICLKTAMGEDLFAPDAKRLETLLEYQLMLLKPQGVGYPSFGDASASNTPLLALVLATYQRNGLAQWYLQNLSCRDDKQVGRWGWNHMMPVAVVTVYDPTLKPTVPAASNLPLAKSFANDPTVMPGLSAVTIMRTGYGNKDDVQVTMRCGPFFGWHSHPDQGSFILSALGETLTIDVAMGGTYGTSANNFSKTAKSHSQVLIDRKGQVEHGPPVYYDYEAGYTGPLTHTPFVDYVLAESTVAYRKNPSIGKMDHADRHFLFVRKPGRRAYLVIIDDVQQDDKKHKYDWLLQTQAKHDIKTAGPGHVVFKGEAELDVFTIEPTQTKVKTSKHFDRWNTLSVGAKTKSPRGVFFTVLYPRRKDEKSPTVKRLAGDGFVGATVNDSETFLFATGDGPIETDQIQSDARIVATGRTEGKLAWVLSVDGKAVTIDGQAVLQSDVPVTAAFDRQETTEVTGKDKGTVKILLGRERTVSVP